jgi:hypothetical protein
MIIVIKTTEAMLKNNVHDLVHHNEVQFGIVKVLEEINAKGDSFTIGTRSFLVLVNGIAHMHQQKAKKAMVAQYAHSR